MEINETPCKIHPNEKSLSGEKNLSNKNVLISLFLILIIGFVLRTYGLSIRSLWVDELFTWRISNQENLAELLKAIRFNEGIPPAYELVVYLIMKYIGDSESILRFPSAICSTISIFVIFLLGTKLYSYREGLTAAALLAVLACPISFGQEARPYAMLLLFTLLATFLWIKLLRCLNEKSKPSYYTLLGYIITAIISSYLHYFGLYLIMLQGLGALLFFIRRKLALLYVLLIYFVISLAYLPWLPAMLDQMRGSASTWIPTPELFLSLRNFLRFLFNGSNALALSAVVMYMFLFFHSLHRIVKTKEYKDMRMMLLSPDLLLVLWLVVPFAGMYIKSIISTPILYPRYLIISLPAAYFLLARSITQLPIHSRNQTILTCAITALLLFHTVFIRNLYSESPHNTQQLREAVGYIVERNHLYKDSIITGNTFLINYYFQKKGSDRRVELGDSKSDAAVVISEKNPQYVWYICGHWNCPDKEYLNFLYKNLKLVEHRKFFGSGVWLFERNKNGVRP